MTPFEKIKREYLIEALDEEFDLSDLVTNIGYKYFHNRKVIYDEVKK